uniref:Uncharacterized protein n=1 Tax=Timema poppense TaxID=170557 RepID=A0A7R9DVQ9_TIMPO|nr:unnamed protein product [Timema poppensis]
MFVVCPCRLVKWADTATPGRSTPSATSLSLVPVQEYNTLYQHLKKKYGKEMVKIGGVNLTPKYAPILQQTLPPQRLAARSMSSAQNALQSIRKETR